MLNQYSNSGRLRIGIKHFGQMLVNGLSLVPNPADNNRAFNYLQESILINLSDKLCRMNWCAISTKP